MNESSSQNAPICPGVGSQIATVCLPVSINPYAVTGPATIQCCGNMIITPYCDCCKGKASESCDFTITQTIKIDIPVEFGATVKIGDSYVECDCTNYTMNENCPNCKVDENCSNYTMEEDLSHRYPDD